MQHNEFKHVFDELCIFLSIVYYEMVLFYLNYNTCYGNKTNLIIYKKLLFIFLIFQSIIICEKIIQNLIV